MITIHLRKCDATDEHTDEFPLCALCVVHYILLTDTVDIPLCILRCVWAKFSDERESCNENKCKFNVWLARNFLGWIPVLYEMI